MKGLTQYNEEFAQLVILTRCALVCHSNGLIKGDCKASCQREAAANVRDAFKMMFNNRIMSNKNDDDLKLIQMALLNLVFLGGHSFLTADVGAVVWHLIQFGITNDIANLRQIYLLIFQYGRLDIKDATRGASLPKMPRAQDKQLYLKSCGVFVTHTLHSEKARREVEKYVDSLKAIGAKIPYLVTPAADYGEKVYNAFLVAVYAVFCFVHFARDGEIANSVYNVLVRSLSFIWACKLNRQYFAGDFKKAIEKLIEGVENECYNAGTAVNCLEG